MYQPVPSDRGPALSGALPPTAHLVPVGGVPTVVVPRPVVLAPGAALRGRSPLASGQRLVAVHGPPVLRAQSSVVLPQGAVLVRSGPLALAPGQPLSWAAVPVAGQVPVAATAVLAPPAVVLQQPLGAEAAPQGGLPQPQHQQQQPPPRQQAPPGSSEGHFVELLESLEARVDLMSQMQQTRAVLQQRARALGSLQVTGSAYGGSEDGWGGDLPQEPLEVSGAPFGFSSDGEETWREDLQPAAPPGSQGFLAEEDCAQDPELWARFMEQRECLSNLTGQVENMRQQLLVLGSHTSGEQAGERHAFLRSSTTTTDASTALGSCGRYLEADRFAGNPGAFSTLGYEDGLDVTQPVRPLGSSAAGRLPPLCGPSAPLGTAPFSSETCGANLQLSADGYAVSRTRGCRQAVAIGSAPLEVQAYGRYFEVVVEETVDGWVGGLGIGATATPPGQLRRIPDKAWRMPRTFIVGYWGCIFLDGVERRTAWRSDALTPGSRVGALVTADTQELILFVNGTPVVRTECLQLSPQEPLYPVVDVFAATRAVSLLKHASPPPPPWSVKEGLEVASPGTPPRSLADNMSHVGSVIRPAA